MYNASDGKPKWSRTTPCVRDLLLWLKINYGFCD